MSLDFYLESDPQECTCIHCDSKIMRSEQLFWRNITHNLGKMADEAGIYGALWRPDEHGYNKASDIIPLLKAGLSDLLNRPEYFKQFNAKNGWGLYEHFVQFVAECLKACEENPTANVLVSR